MSSYNDYVQCPYDKAHRILKSRIQTHIVKCARNFPNAEVETCRFNSTHIIDKQKIDWHEQVCEDRAFFEKFKYNIIESSQSKPEVQIIGPDNKNILESSEDWSDVCEPSYNPQKYCRTANILRSKPGVSKSERKAFREAEDERLRKLANS